MIKKIKLWWKIWQLDWQIKQLKNEFINHRWEAVAEHRGYKRQYHYDCCRDIQIQIADLKIKRAKLITEL